MEHAPPRKQLYLEVVAAGYMCWLAGLSWRLAECHGRGLNPGRLRRNARRAAHHPPWAALRAAALALSAKAIAIQAQRLKELRAASQIN